jgi:hypothetical protein
MSECLRYISIENGKTQSQLFNKVNQIFYINEFDNKVILDPDRNILQKINKVMLIKDAGSVEYHNVRCNEESLIFTDTNEDIVQIRLLPLESDPVVDFLSNYINQLTFESLLGHYNGIRYWQEAFAGVGNTTIKASLGSNQIGDEREIELTQVEDVFYEVQETAEQSARNMLHAFPEWTVTQETSGEELAAILKEVEEYKNDIVFSWIYFRRWYRYFIQGVRVSDLMYGRLSLFSKDNRQSNLQILKSVFQIFNMRPYGGVDYFYTSCFFQADIFYKDSNSLYGSNKGFDNPDLRDVNGILSMGSIVEFLIRIFAGHDDYQGWFESLGFYTATSRFDTSLPLENKSLWQALRSGEQGIGQRFNPAFITALLAVKYKDGVIVANSPAEIILGNSTRLASGESRSPEELAQLYVDNALRPLQFYWDTGDEKVRENLKAWLIAPVTFTIDCGEIVGNNQRDFYDPENIFCYELMPAVSLESCSYMSWLGSNGTTLTVKNANPMVIMGLKSLVEEFTVSHELAHRYDAKFVSYDGGVRYSGEEMAPFFQNDTETIRLNNTYFSKSNYWNQRPPVSHEELVSYTSNYLDLIYIWNLEKAKAVFRLNPVEQRKHVYIGSFDTPSSSDVELFIHKENLQIPKEVSSYLKLADTTKLIARRITEEQLNTIALDPEAEDFIDKLVENHIIIPYSLRADEYVAADLSLNNSGVDVQRHAFFNIPYTGGDWASSITEPTVFGFSSYWCYETISQKGWAGMNGFRSKKHGTTDLAALQGTLGIDYAPEQYLIEKYKAAQEKLNSDSLLLYTKEELRKIINDNIDNDGERKTEFIATFIKNCNNLFDSIYK